MYGFILFAALSATAPDTPQPASSQDSSDIVVEGVRRQRERVHQFVKALDDVPLFGQIAKFHSPVCPVAIGLPADQSQRVAERMRRVAQSAGIRTGDSRCAPNVFLIAATAKGSTIEALSNRYPAYFRGMGGKEVRKLAAATTPSVAWQIKSLLSADGTMLKKTPMDGYVINEGMSSGSRIRAGTMPHFVASIVVVERAALTGLTTTQVGDFAAMRAFADTDPKRAAKAGAPTILTILDKGEDEPLPVTLTHWDLGYLKSLYATSNDYYASYQRGEMEQVLKKEMERAGQ
jgi:hypothetical protein